MAPNFPTCFLLSTLRSFAFSALVATTLRINFPLSLLISHPTPLSSRLHRVEYFSLPPFHVLLFGQACVMLLPFPKLSRFPSPVNKLLFPSKRPKSCRVFNCSHTHSPPPLVPPPSFASDPPPAIFTLLSAFFFPILPRVARTHQSFGFFVCGLNWIVQIRSCHVFRSTSTKTPGFP